MAATKELKISGMRRSFGFHECWVLLQVWMRASNRYAAMPGADFLDPWKVHDWISEWRIGNGACRHHEEGGLRAPGADARVAEEVLFK
jgi:hypothetical protein